jgi:diphosphomevalonate decarboxylase
MVFDKNAAPKHRQGRITWESPSNIAILKYWGKMFEQLPYNPSLSMSLSKAMTQTTVDYNYNPGSNCFSVEFYFDGVENEAFSPRIEKYLKRLAVIYPSLLDCRFRIDSHNSFPHSSGIASSASAMSALALCISSMMYEIQDKGFFMRASYLSRLGSGSAARSVYGGWTLWGETELKESTSNEVAVPLNDMIHPDFQEVRDAILIVSEGKKDVSSSAGHQLMEYHFYKKGRFDQTGKHLGILLRSLKEGNWGDFIRIAENEALSLHGLMMSSDPSYMLIKPETVIIINEIRKFREQFEIPVCFTLDAGPNVHLIFPDKESQRVVPFIKDKLEQHCQDSRWIEDRIGRGPELIEQKYA